MLIIKKGFVFVFKKIKKVVFIRTFLKFLDAFNVNEALLL